MNIEFNAFKNFCNSLSGPTLTTLSRNREFEFKVYEESEIRFCFTPQCTGTPRFVGQKYIEGYIGQFNTNSGSLRPVDYGGGFNPSYMVALFKRYQDHFGASGMSAL